MLALGYMKSEVVTPHLAEQASLPAEQNTICEESWESAQQTQMHLQAWWCCEELACKVVLGAHT